MGKFNKDYFVDSDSYIVPEIVNPYPEYLVFLDGETVRGRIRFPDCLKETVIHRAISDYLHHRNLGVLTKQSAFRIYKRVFEALEDVRDIEEALLLRLISKRISELQGKDGQQISDKVAYDIQMKFITPCKQMLMEAHISKQERLVINSMLSNSPRFARARNNALKAMAEYFPNLDYSNQEYLDALRAISFEQMSVWQNIRKRFKSECSDLYLELKELIRSSPELNLNDPVSLTFKYTRFQGDQRLTIRRVIGLYVEAALKLDDPFFIETLFIGIAFQNSHASFLIRKTDNHWSLNKHVTHNYKREILKRYISNGLLRVRGRVFKKRNSRKQMIQMGRLRIPPPLSLIAPFGVDELDTLIAFLATERCSIDGIIDFNLNNITFINSDGSEVDVNSHNANRCFITMSKERSNRSFSTEHFKRGSGIYNYLKELVNSYKELFSEGLLNEKDSKEPLRRFFGTNINPQLVKASYFKKGLNRSVGVSRTVPMIIEGSHYSTTFTNPTTEPFLEIMKLCSVKLGTKDRGDWINDYFLPLSAIKQARIYADENKDLNNYGLSDDLTIGYSDSLYRKLEDDAEQQQHNLSTRLNTYYSRSQDKSVIESKEKFASQVGDEMWKIAEEMAASKQGSTSLLTLSEAKAAFGLSEKENEYTAEEILSQIDLQNTVITDTGFIQSNGDTIIIKSPLHACLIQKKIEHIDSELERLMLSNKDLVPRAISQRILLKVTLSNFEDSMIRQGLEVYAKNDFKFPSLVIALGGYEA